ncbi:MAG: DUF58 domain-containing protein [Armatimonadetes bacterium]|nr:DUF58 domain-containing protein [Armatimonadota bacterium]
MLAGRRSTRFVTVMFGALFIFLVALLFRLPNLFFMASVLVAAPVVSYAFASMGLRTVRAERRVPARLWPGERSEIELRVVNDAKLPKALLLIDEELPPGLEGDHEQPPNCVVPMLWGEPFCYRYPITARVRGRYRLPAVQATAVDTFDLFGAHRAVGPADEVIVYPETVQLSADTLTGTKLVAAVSDHRTHDGTDFRHTREYRPGDDLRRIHWPSTARLGKPIVVEYEEPTSSNLFIVLDASPDAVLGTDRDTTFETGVTLAASLIRHELEHGSAVGLFVDADPPILLPLTDDRQALLEFFERLAVVEPNATRPFAETLLAAGELAPAGTRMFAISSAPWPERRHVEAAVESEPEGPTRGQKIGRFLYELFVGPIAEEPAVVADPLMDAFEQGRPPAEGGAVLAALTELARRRRSISLAYLDPRGYRGVPADVVPSMGFIGAAKATGASAFMVARGAVAAGLRHTV